MPATLSTRRFWVLQFFVASLFILVAYQLFQLTIIRRDTLLQLAEKQHHLRVDIPPVRGKILDRQGKELAASLKVPSIYAVPRLVSSKEKASLANTLSKILDLKKDYVRGRLEKDKAFIWLKRRVSYEEAEKIRQLEHAGLGVLEEYKRFYPQGDLLAQVLGIVNIDNQGMEGIELKYNHELKGRPGRRYTKRDALGREIKAFEMEAVPAVNGHSIYLTIDQYLQYVTERALDRAYKRWNAKGAAAILMEAKTGRILAMANRPTFDPNNFGTSKGEERRNRAVTDMYEPGSIFKIVPFSAAFDKEKINFDMEIDCENGEYRYGSRILHDAHPYDMLSVPEVLIKSSNIGTVKIAKKLKPKVFFDYIEGFGFRKLTKVDLPGEASGFIRPPKKWSKTSPYNIPMGHEVMVTLLQMTNAMAVVANGGELPTPFIVSRIEDEVGITIKETIPQMKRRVITTETAKIMQELLTAVVEEGTGRRAKIEGMPVGGKTGTAQKVLPNGKGYSHDNFISSFVGFAPSHDPELVMAVMLDDPGPRYYGGTVAAPVFQEVIESALHSIGYIPENAELFNPSPSVKNPQANPPLLLKA